MKKIIVFLSLFSSIIFSQNRIHYNDQDLFLSGANLAWLSFANDVGNGTVNLDKFGEILLQIHENGGNALRWWLHTNGTNSPEFDNSAFVIGPGEYTIQDIKAVLDLAWEREVGIKLCLWSFDMLRKNLNVEIRDRNILLLTDTLYTNAYIKNALIPMVDSLKGHPAIIAWEIFNEPEGMSEEFGWSEILHVPMSDIQRFINLTSAAIHKTDTTAQVTSGCWSIQAMTDVPTSNLSKISEQFVEVDKQELANLINHKYGLNLTTNEVFVHLDKISAQPNHNYYSDSELINAGGDSLGILDFYSVHYYDWAGVTLSPFHNPADFWQLDKPLVLAEFHLKNTLGIPKDSLYNKLYQMNYAGALGWSWTDNNVTNPQDMLNGMKMLWENYRDDVDVIGIGGDWPQIEIISPVNGAIIEDTSTVDIEINATDADGNIELVEIFVNDSLKIAELISEPYIYSWQVDEPGNYDIKGVATDNDGHSRKSNIVKIVYGTPPFERLEAESTIYYGENVSSVEDPTASGGKYLDMASNNGTIIWNFTNNNSAGIYEIKFAAKLIYDTPKTQYIIVNDDTTELEFTGDQNTWIEKSIFVELVEGQNTIKMIMFWGWMAVDYLAVPTEVVTSVYEFTQIPNTLELFQNYPNPFNPTTNINYTIPNVADANDASATNVKLVIYDILGREVQTLVNKNQTPGNYKVIFNADKLSSGVYLYNLSFGGKVLSKKMLLIK